MKRWNVLSVPPFSFDARSICLSLCFHTRFLVAKSRIAGVNQSRFRMESYRYHSFSKFGHAWSRHSWAEIDER